MGEVDPPALNSQNSEGVVMGGLTELRLVPFPNVGPKGIVSTTFQDWEDFLLLPFLLDVSQVIFFVFWPESALLTLNVPVTGLKVTLL